MTAMEVRLFMRIVITLLAIIAFTVLSILADVSPTYHVGFSGTSHNFWTATAFAPILLALLYWRHGRDD